MSSLNMLKSILFKIKYSLSTAILEKDLQFWRKKSKIKLKSSKSLVIYKKSLFFPSLKTKMLKLSNNYQLLTTKSTCLKITSTSFAFISKYLSKIFTNKFSKNFKFLVQNPNKHVIMTCLSTYLLSLINKFSTNFRSKKLMTYMFNIWKASLSFC